ncbi:gamma-glutamyltransferase [uncultured Erythrobacter sp.]|uniref:gamma-glutamyltransferase n=1 Tax=uncultured Erythrobacter sp. TaxID=263913 RepID=UPI00262A1C86|nr:gamma-glutamyltransferase [uncultured Erythrobacter sp.]
MFKPLALLSPLALLLTGCADYANPIAASAAGVTEPATSATQGAVSSADPRATAAGEAILAQGGSATDAAIAVMLALTVVEPQSSGIGGGGFMIHAGADGVTTIDGRETAPATATGARFLDQNGERLPGSIRTTSGLSVGVPGNIALAADAHAKYGKLPWADLFKPAIALARDGFVMNRRLHGTLSDRLERAGKTEAARAIFFGADGNPLPVGTRITVPDLADTFERLAADGPGAFYDSSAQEFADYVAGETPQDGRLAPSDVSAYTAKLRDPVCSPYRSYTVCGMGPPSSGGVAVAQMLGQLERFDIAALGPQSPEFWHLFVESQRIAYADRELYIGDADFVEVPVAGLIDRDYIASRSAMIDPASALDSVEPGTPPGAPLARADGDEPAENGTTHFSVVDADGSAVSYTSTIEGAFGSGLHWGGFYLNNELTDFSLSPEIDGMPVANRVEGGKRPRSSMAPTIVFDENGEVILVIGAAGGPTIPVQVARSIIGVLDFGMSAEEALGLPLIMAFGPTVITEEGSAIASMVDDLRARGHSQIRLLSPRGKANALLRTEDGWESAGDPRVADLLGYE